MEQERKLAEYRARKKREQQKEHYKENIMNMFKWKRANLNDIPESETLINTPEEEEPAETHSKSINIIPTEVQSNYNSYKIRREFYILFFILWLATYILFIKLQFGIVYLIISAIFGIYLNTRTGPKDENEISAYSVFNKNCESIDGTLKAEQFEREIRYGPLNVH